MATSYHIVSPGPSNAVLQQQCTVLQCPEIAHLDASPNRGRPELLTINKKIRAKMKNNICFLILITFVHF